MDLHKTPNPLNRDARNKENENWDEIQRKFTNVVEEVSDKAFSKVVDGSKIDWSQMVDDISDLPTNAETGETRGVKSDNKIYRFNGSDWIPIAEINLNPISEVDQRLTTQLADMEQQKANESDVIQQINETKNEAKDYADSLFVNLDGLQIKGSFDTLNDLNNAFPDGTEGLYVVDEKLYGWNGIEWKKVKDMDIFPWSNYMYETGEVINSE